MLDEERCKSLEDGGRQMKLLTMDERGKRQQAKRRYPMRMEGEMWCG